MDAHELAEALIGVTLANPDTDDPGIDNAIDAYTFAEGGLMTDGAGIVITLADGSEFQVTVVQSKAGAADDAEVTR